MRQCVAEEERKRYITMILEREMERLLKENVIPLLDDSNKAFISFEQINQYSEVKVVIDTGEMNFTKIINGIYIPSNIGVICEVFEKISEKVNLKIDQKEKMLDLPKYEGYKYEISKRKQS